MSDKPALPPAPAPISVEIGTLALTGVSRGYGERAAASFEAALPQALAGLSAADLHPDAGSRPLTLAASPRLPPEEFGRRLARQVAEGLRR
ncbi:MAG: hypothetical protein H6844_08520 [Alphaproteobacteria bacterium]|nr:hypothetical protein [Alphaproteobacteria bacterium]